MRMMVIVLFTLALRPGLAQSERTWEQAQRRAENTRRIEVAAQTAGQIGQVLIWDRQHKREIDARDRESARQASVQVHQAEIWRDISLAQIDAQVEMDRNRTAAEVFRTGAQTGRTGTASASGGRVQVHLDPQPRSEPEEFPKRRPGVNPR